MKLAAPGLTLELRPISCASAEDWAQIRTLASVSGFTVDFLAYLQSADVCRFLESLQAMHRDLSAGSKAVLGSAEPGILISLSMHPLGRIEGRYCFESERREHEATVLSGSFELDQSFLPSLIGETESLLHALASRGAA